MISNIDAAQKRREQVFDTMVENSIMMVTSGEEQIRNLDVEFPFRVHSDFHYLTGFEEPDAVLVLIKRNQESQTKQKAVLFLRPKDLEKEIWQGRRLGVADAPATLLMDDAFSIEDFEDEMSDLVEGIETLYFSFAQLSEWSDLLSGWISAQKAKSRKGIEAPATLSDADVILHEMRLVKSSEEIEWMKQAAQISVQGHLAAMSWVAKSIAKSARLGKAQDFEPVFEYQMQAALEHKFKELGSARVAFNSIVAGGENACILHYTENNARLKAGDLVLVDAGAEYQGYAGDITNTFPVDGRFSEAQRALYQIVLDAQQAAISAIAPGVRYDEMHKASTRVLVEGLVGLGILKGEISTLLENEAYKPFFMHGTGHWLGRDVHDVGRYKLKGQWRPLEPGMIITVEPGLYISEEVGREHQVDEKYWNIGIRIEDDVLVTYSGHEVLTFGLPRAPEEIELFMENAAVGDEG